jgi:hypothetical protein
VSDTFTVRGPEDAGRRQWAFLIKFEQAQ